MLFATWNVNSLKARMPRVEEWLESTRPDVVCLQETKLSDAQFPHMAFQALGYDSVHHGFGQWNGVAVISRTELSEVVTGFDDAAPPDPDARIIWATTGGVRVGSVYVPNGRSLDDDHYRYKLDWLARLRVYLDTHHQPSEMLVVMGDWNVAPDDRDVWNPAAFEGSTHVSVPEREALERVKQWGLIDTFRERFEAGGLFSYWDYRAGDFHEKRGMRIDYLLSSTAMAGRNVADLIDRNARKGTKPSDHAPVMAQFDL